MGSFGYTLVWKVLNILEEREVRVQRKSKAGVIKTLLCNEYDNFCFAKEPGEGNDLDPKSAWQKKPHGPNPPSQFQIIYCL